MSLLTDASLLLTPNAYKASKLYSVIPSNGNGDFTATRATTATRINSSGLVENVALNIPRVDYSLGGCPNILLEPQRTNLALQSSSFDSASWLKTGGVIVNPNTTDSPSGIQDADTITAPNTNPSAVVQTPSIVSGTNYTISFYAKQNTQRFVYIRLTSNTLVDNYVSVVFDLQDGTVGQSVVGAISGTLVSATTQIAENGFYRIIITAAVNSTAGNIGIGFANSKTGNIFNNFGAITSTIITGNSFFLWGAQLEAGAYATSFIPTTTASVTRNADSITRNNIFTNGLITAEGGTWFVELRNNRVLTRDGFQTGLSLDDNAFLNSIRITNAGTQRVSIFLNWGGTSSTAFTTTADNCKLALKFNGSTLDIFQNGVKVVNATTFAPNISLMQSLRVNPNGIPYFINQMALFPTPLSDSKLISMTTL